MNGGLKRVGQLNLFQTTPPPPTQHHHHITTRPPIVLFLTTYPVSLHVIRDHIYQHYSTYLICCAIVPQAYIGVVSKSRSLFIRLIISRRGEEAICRSGNMSKCPARKAGVCWEQCDRQLAHHPRCASKHFSVFQIRREIGVAPEKNMC